MYEYEYMHELYKPVFLSLLIHLVAGGIGVAKPFSLKHGTCGSRLGGLSEKV